MDRIQKIKYDAGCGGLSGKFRRPKKRNYTLRNKNIIFKPNSPQRFKVIKDEELDNLTDSFYVRQLEISRRRQSLPFYLKDYY